MTANPLSEEALEKLGKWAADWPYWKCTDAAVDAIRALLADHARLRKEAAAAESALSAERQRVADVLRPFATMGRLIDGRFYGGDKADDAAFRSGGAWMEKDGSTGTIRIKHLRAASRLYDELKGSDHG